jgi:transposase
MISTIGHLCDEVCLCRRLGANPTSARVVEGWGVVVLTDAQWAELEPLVSACRPHAKVPPSDLRRTVEAIVWRCTNGAKWRSIPAELGPWWKAAQIFIRWARLGVWDRLLAMAQARGVELGVVFLDGTSIRAHAKAAGPYAQAWPWRVTGGAIRLAGV